MTKKTKEEIEAWIEEYTCLTRKRRPDPCWALIDEDIYFIRIYADTYQFDWDSDHPRKVKAVPFDAETKAKLSELYPKKDNDNNVIIKELIARVEELEAEKESGEFESYRNKALVKEAEKSGKRIKELEKENNRLKAHFAYIKSMKVE
jgi:hypothetical protein